MVRETNNVCFGQIAQETQVVVREDNKRDHLKRSTEDVSPPNFSERNSGYYERNSRLVSETDSYLRRSNNNSYQSSSSNSSNTINSNSSSSSSSCNNNNSSSNNPDNRSRTRDRLYRNGPNAVGVSTTTGSSTATLLSERTSSGASSNKINNSRVPPTSWYEAAATYTNGPGGSGNADVSAANINHYQTAASTELQTAATTNSTTTSSYTAYSYASSPAHNNNNSHNTTSTTTSSSSSRNSTFYGKETDKDSEANLSTTPPLLNKNKQKLLKSSSLRSGSSSPTSSSTTTTFIGGGSGAGLATMTSSSSTAASASSSASSSSLSSTSNNNINNSRSNQTANNSCSSVSSTINSSNTNTNNNSLSGNSSSVTNTDNTLSGGSGNGNVSGILNAAALAAAASKGGSSSIDGHKNHSSSGGGIVNSSSNASASGNTSSNNPSTSASHHTSRSAAHAHFHGRSTTSSSRSHSRSPSSYSSSHSSSSSSSSTASSHSHASSPVGGRDVEASSVGHTSSSRSGSRSLQSAVAVPGTSSSGLNHPSGSNVCGSSSSSTSSTSSGTPTGNPVVHSEDNRPLAIRVRNLPARSSDTSLKDGLFHEYKKHGKVTWVKVVGQNAERYALVCFKKPEDVEKALEVSHDKLFFGCKIEVEPYQGYDVEDNEFRPYEAELDEYHPKSTRTLFIGNLEKEITASELRQHFECFGEIIEIDIKKQGMSAYAFCQYSDIVSVVKAMRKMDGEHLGNNRIKLGFGKSMPTNCVWIDGIGEKISESHLQSQFSRYGAVSKVVVDRQRQLALVLYEQIQYAQTAVKEMRGATLRGRKLQVDFASRECQDAFYEKLEKQSTGSRFNRYESQSRSRASSFSRHQNSNDGCSPGNTPGSSSSSSAGVPSSAPALSSAIVTGSSALSNTASSNTLASVVGQASGNTTPARSRGSRSSRHTMDYEYLDTRRFRSCDEYSQGSATSHDEDNSAVNHPSSNTNSYSGIGLRSDSPLLSRLGPIVNSSGKESSSEMLEFALSRRRCDKSPAKQKGDIRSFQKERAVLLEQLEECPSSGDESIVSPRKRIKIDHHSINSSSGLTQSHSMDEQQPQHKNSNCDYLLNDPMHRKSEVRRLSECNSSLNKYPTPQQNHHHSHHAVPPPPPHHHHHQQQLSRRPSIDFMATSGGGVAGGVSSLSTRHNSTSSSNSDHHPPPHQSSSSSSLACKRRRVIGSSNAIVTSSSLLSGSTGGNSNMSNFGNDDCHHHTSRGRGHQLHSHHSHEASGGESADGSRPGTPLCDERPEVLPSEPRRVPRERPREPMVLPLPKFGIQFFHQYRNSIAAGNTPIYHHVGGSFSSSSAAGGLGGSNNSGSSHLLSNSILNRGEGGISNSSHSSLSHSSATITPTSTVPTGTSSSGCYLPSPSTRYTPHWRPHHHQHHHHNQQHGGVHHGPSGGATPSSSSSMVSPMRSRSLSSNSSDSDVPGQSSTGSPSLEERIRTLDEMYERWSGGGTNSSNIAVGSNVVKRHDFNHTPPTWQHHRSNSQSDSHHSSNSDVRSNATPSTPASRHKFLDIDVNEMQPSDIVKSVLAKKSIFDDDLQRLKKNHWYEPSSDSSQLSKAIMGVCTSPGLPNLQATKTPVVGCTTSLPGSGAVSSLNKPSGALLQRLSSLSPMNSPQASISPYNSPSPSPSVTLSSVPLVSNTTMTKASGIGSCVAPGSQTPSSTATLSTSPAASGGTKCLQYPFPTHPPLPNTAAPVQSAQPIPPPPAESSKPCIAQPPLPPMEVLQPPQPPATSPISSATTTGSSTKPKTSALSKSLSVPPPPPSTTTTESRIFTKSVSVPGSTNLGTVKSTADASAVSLTAAPHLEQNQPQQTTTGSSSLHPSKSHNKEDKEDTLSKPPSHTSSSSTSTSDNVVKRGEKSHKHNHRSNEDKKSSKNDRRKNSNSSQSHLSQASAAESSDADEHDSKKERKERQERREKELRKQQEREEREREEREREEREREEKERLERERQEAERIEKERVENERLEKERLEKEERERVQREKERLRKEEEQRAKEERERKEREEKERKLNEQREREENERREREEAERREREEREEQLRKERKEREELEQKEKEKLERQRMREEKERERKAQEEANTEHKRDINLLKEHQRRKENAASQNQSKTGNDMTNATSQSAHDFFRQGETERQNNKENSTEESSVLDTACASSKHKNRKTSRNTSPVRHPKRRLSSQDSNASNSAASASYVNTDDHAKRMRIDLQSTTNQPQTTVNNNHNSVNNVINERRDSKEHHAKERSNKHNRVASSGHKTGNIVNQSTEKEHNTKHHRNKHHHKVQPTTQGPNEASDVNLSKQESEHVTSNCMTKAEDDHQNTDHDMELKPKIPSLLSSDEEEVSENPSTVTQHHNKNVSGNHKHREHGSGHHSRHKSNKRERDHHREKKRHSSSAGPQNSANVNELVPSTPPSANCNVTDEETMASAGNQLAHRRTSGHGTSFEVNAKSKHDVSDRKLSRCSDDGNGVQPQTPSHRQNNFNKSTPQSSSRRVLLSSAEDTDGGGGIGGMGADDDDDSDNRQHSIFDIPDDGPYVSMYDKVKARSCKNMQKQEEEKKIKAKFSQLKQSRAKREEKKRSTSYDGDSDSDFDGGSSEHQKQHNRSGGSYKMLTGGLSSTDDDQDMEAGCKTPSRDRRRSSQASSSATSIHPNRLCSDSDDNSVTQRRLKLQDNLRRLCDDGDDTSEDDLIRRHNSGLANKRLLHHTSRIASDSESQSQSAVDIKLKQEPLETSNDGATTPVLKHLKQRIKKEVDAMEASGETADFNEFKFKSLSSMCSSADEQSNIKSESTGELLSANEIKKESKDYYADEYLQSEQKFHKSPMAPASQHCSPEQAKIKKHKKSKKRQKTPTQDSLVKEHIMADNLVKHTSPATNAAFLSLGSDTKNSKLLTSPCYDAFDELKRGDTLVTHASPEQQITAEKKRHKERKEKKREKLRHLSADVGSGVELDKMVYEKEKHRLKKSKKSKSLDVMRQTSTSTPSAGSTVNVQQPLMSTVPAACTPQHKQRSGGEKMEDIFGPISDEDDEDLSDSDIGGRDLNCITNRNNSSTNMPGPIVSAALNPYKQEPLTPKSHTVEENEENKQKLTCTTLIGASAHLERVAERQHRKEKREKKRKEREKSRSSEQTQSIGFLPSPAVSTAKPMEDENSVDLDAAGRALEAQLMEDSDNKTVEEATPPTANTYHSDMTDVFHFSDCDENSLEMSSTNKHEKKEIEKEHTSNIGCKNKEKKKKKKRSKEEKQLHHQRRESSSSNASQLASTMVAPSTSTTKLTIDVQAATKHAQKSTEDHLPSSSSPLCKPSPSLPCLIGDDDDDLNALQGGSKSTPNTSLTNVPSSICTTPHRSSSKDMLTLSPHMKDKQMISPIPKTPTINSNSCLSTSDNLNKVEVTTPSTPTSSMVGTSDNTNANLNTTPTSSTAAAAKILNKSNDSSTSSNVMDSPSSSLHTTQQKKKPEIFIPGFDGEIDERISESAVQSISAEFNPPLDPMADEPKIPVESPPDASKLEKLEESKSRVTISQEETESAVSALLGESFGNSSADYSFNDDDDGLDDLNNAITDPEPVMALGEPDEEAALAAKAIECEVASSAITDNVEQDTEEVCKAIQSLRQEELDIKADTPQSVRDLQIDTDTEENVDEADSSGSHSLKIDETAQSNNSSTASDKANTSINQTLDDPTQPTTADADVNTVPKSSVITKVESPVKTQPVNVVTTEPKIEPPTISKQDQPAVQPVQAVMSPATLEVSIPSTASTNTVVSSSSMSTSMNTTILAGVSMSYTSTPIKTSITFAPTSTSSSTPKQTHLVAGKSISTSSATAGYVMQPPTITIPEPSTHFVVPQLVLSPRGVVTTPHHNDSSSSSSASMHSPSGHHMPPQSPVGATYLMGVRAQSPHSPRQHTSRGNTPTPRQPSPHTPTPTPTPIAVTTQQQQNLLIQRTVNHQQNLMSPPSQGHVSQNNSPLASPTMQQRQIAQGVAMHKVTPQQQQPSPNAPDQHMIKINNYSTPPAQTLNMVNIRIPPPSPQHQHGQQPSPQQMSHGKSVIDQQQQHVPMGQHILPISVQKMPPVPTHPTIISKVVTVTPQQAQQSIMQPGTTVPSGNLYSPPTSGGSGANQSRQSSQIFQQITGKQLHQQQQQSPQMQFMQQQQRQQQHMLQMQQQQIIHQQQKLPQQQQTASLLAQQQHHQQHQQQQSQHNFVVTQQRNLPSPQQIQQQQSQNTQQQQQQLKVQYQQHQMLAPSQQSPNHQQNVIQNSPLPQRFLVQQHIVGLSAQQHQQQQQQHSGPHQQTQTNSSPNQLQNSNTQQKPTAIFGKHQQQQQHHHLLQQRQQSPSPHRLLQQQPEVIKESPRVIMSTSQSTQQIETLPTTPVASKPNVDKQSSSPTASMTPGNKPAEVVSVIRTPTPTTTATSPIISSLTPNTTMASNKESVTTTTASNTSRSVPLTEENVIKISPPKHDEIEQDSKEDSDYWSAKELNMVETNNTTNSNVSASVSAVSTVIKKNESVNTTETIVSTPTPTQPTNNKEETKSSQTQLNKTDNKSNNQAPKSEVDVVTATESQGNPAANIVTNTNTTSSYSQNQNQSGNVTTDHDTEDETETQQMPAFEQVPVQGRPSTRGTGTKRGRQPRGGKKAAASTNISNIPINVNINTQPLQTELGAAAGVQTRLRKPNTAAPATRGRKGRPPRNLLLQQQQLQQHHEQPPTPTTQASSPNSSTSSTTTSNVPLVTTAPVLTAAEKKARSQAAAAAAALASLAESNQQQDVYEFHDESGDEGKAAPTTTTLSTTTTTTTSSTTSSDHRPRLILTIKSPAPGSTPLVKASEKAVNIEPNAVKSQNEQQQSALQDNLANVVSQPTTATIQQTNQTVEPTVAELAAAANTRKSRRLLEKDRSTIDDIIEDVVRNNANNPAGVNAMALAASATNVLTNSLPKGAQTPPRRSGRNSAQSKPSKPQVEAIQSAAANPIGRPRKSKDRKNTNELDIEQTPSPQPKHLVHDISDVEDAKSVNTPPPADVINVQTTHQQQQQPQPTQVPAANTTLAPQQQSLTITTTTSSASIPQHPKKKALAAAEIESYQSSAATATATSTSTPNIHSALPAGGVPMLNTAAPATQKTTGGAAESVNKPLIDPVTGVVSGLQMQQAKEGNLPSATAASQPLRGPMDPKKMMQAAAAAAAAESNALNSKLQNTSSLAASVAATPITTLTKPQQVEAAAVTHVPASTVATAMLNKSVSVVVKTSTLSPTSTPPPGNMGMQQHLQQSQQHRQDVAAPQKQPIIMQQQTTTVMHAQHTNVRPPTTLKAHVLNSQKLQQQQASHQQYTQQQQQQTHQILHQQPTTSQSVGVTSQTPTHIIQNTIVQRPTVNQQQQQQLPPANKQLLVNIPPTAGTNPTHGQANDLNSPRHLHQQPQQQQQQPQTLPSQQSLVIKQAHDMHTPQVLHVVSSKTSAPTTQTNKPLQSTSTLHQHQAPNASPHPSYATYIQTPPVGVHSKQQQQLPQKPVVIHQQTIGVPQKNSTTPLVMPPGILGLPPHPAMVIQTKTSAPAQSPSSSATPATAAAAAHLQHANQHTPSPPLQPPPPQHLVKSSSNPMLHSLQTQGVSHVLNTVASPSPPSAVKPNAQQSQSIVSNVGASSLRTAIPTISPQSQARIGSILLPGGMQVPSHFETSMSEASFPGGIGRVGVPTREHLMIYQQLLRQHDPLNPAALREYDEKLLGSSPPLELRRPGSVPRTVAVPHSLQSPQDRATDSPQVAQVYVHNTRIPAHTHYDVTGRAGVATQPSPYYDASRQIPLEPPPAHRSAPVHSVVAPPPPTVVVPHPTAGSSSPFMASAPPATAVQQTPSSVPPNHHTKLLEREREQREREREQQLLREKEQIMVRAGADSHNMQVATPPPHQQPTASHQLPPHSQQPPPPPQADSLLTLLQRYPVMWQGLLALKTDQAAVQMHFVFGNPHVARASLPCNSDGSTPPLRIAQRMRLEQTQLEGVAKKMQFENEHCMLLALPCGRDHADVLQQSRNLQSGFITYLQQKMAAGIVNIPIPGSEQAAYVVHIFPSCDFANENLEKAAPDLKNRVADIAHLLIVIATV